MKFFLASAIGFAGASLYKSRSEVQAWGFLNKPAFSQEEFQSYKLINVEEVSHDTRHFRFALATEKTRLDLPIASCISLRFTDEKGQEVIRPYTPINLESDEGHFDLVVKCYPSSKMGSHLFSMKPGDSIEAKGPWHTFELRPSQYNQIGMIAGGTGLTPMLQISKNILSSQGNSTKISLLYSSKSINDVLLGDTLEKMAKKFPGMFATFYCLTTAPKRWTGYTGYIDKRMIQETMPGPEREGDSIILVCGPQPFMKAICGVKDFKSSPPKQGPLGGYLKEMGYAENCVYKF
ncbi:putative NADH-cytochrome b5 reductase [Leptomonas seymouri]|uniref:cytochrome-b5 reductase n=1 Tax=Leptomonas seymouri TaxID=5684 RepID=A0A0N0P6L4_LEPSE|nr:putative NADH-cytochrome b5 reductase [Leptomonas seymouri]|eukprot:KPI87776.1 putative NADH-cytochrome b5 reductase [Leptomonas seymouri]